MEKTKLACRDGTMNGGFQGRHHGAHAWIFFK